MKHLRIASVAAAVNVLSAASLGCMTHALAQPYPAKPIRLVIPYPPGGTTDIVARLVQVKLTGTLGQQIVIDNRGGATGAIGAEMVARARPDGYTIMFTPGTDMVLRHYIMKANPVDVVKDFTPIIAAIKSVDIVAANPAVPFSTAGEFVEYAKRNPGKLSYSTPGFGSHFHLAGELLKIQGVDVLHVPFKGGGPAATAAISGEVNLSFGNLTTMNAMVRDRRLRLVALIDSARNRSFPEVLTLKEALPGFEMPGSWFAFFGPAQMPQPIVARLNSEITRAFDAPDLRAKVEELDTEVITGTPEDVSAMIRQAIATYGRIVKAAGIKPE